MNLHQELSVNTIPTKEEAFSSELYLEGLLLLNPKLLSLNDGAFSSPKIIDNQFNCNTGKIDLLLRFEDFVAVVELKNKG